MDGLNLYAYVRNEPVDLVDPWGLKLPVDYTLTGYFHIDLVPNPFKQGKNWGQTDVRVEFWLEGDTLKCCTEVTMVQVASTWYKARWLNPFMFSQGGGWHWDPLIAGSVWNWKPGVKPARAALEDTPGHDEWYYVEQDFETCAKCISGKWAGEILGCIRWGHKMRKGIVTESYPKSGDYYPDRPMRMQYARGMM